MLMSASITMEVANTTVMTQIQVTHVPAIMATDLTVIDIHVKVSKRRRNLMRCMYSTPVQLWVMKF